LSFIQEGKQMRNSKYLITVLALGGSLLLPQAASANPLAAGLMSVEPAASGSAYSEVEKVAYRHYRRHRYGGYYGHRRYGGYGGYGLRHYGGYDGYGGLRRYGGYGLRRYGGYYGQRRLYGRRYCNENYGNFGSYANYGGDCGYSGYGAEYGLGAPFLGFGFGGWGGEGKRHDLPGSTTK
jgi:hypothetical protein